MTTLELKTKIIKAIDNVPEDALPELFNYVNSIQPSPKKDIRKIIDRIIKEDAALLKRLAE
jgi:hypothetical protein